MRPLVSVGLPTYNRAGNLTGAIDSVLKQDYENLELIISDNASTDETAALCTRYAQRDGRVRYVRQDCNRGLVENFNVVAQLAKGEFFMWLADDDRIGPGFLSAAVRELSSRQDHVLVCGQTRYRLDDGSLVVEKAVTLTEESAWQRVLHYFRLVGGSGGSFYGLIRRAVLPPAPLSNEMGCDWLLIASLVFQGKTRTLERVWIDRGPRGISSSTQEFARLLGQSRFWGAHPYLYMAGAVLRDVVWGSAVYRALGFRRLAFGIHAAAIVGSHGSPLGKLRAKLVIRTRMRSLLHRVFGGSHPQRPPEVPPEPGTPKRAPSNQP